jgi:hypothetical protein
VAEPVVDRLEAVEVDEHQPECPPVPEAAAHGLDQLFVEAAPVVQAGQRIVEGLVVQAVQAERDRAQLGDGGQLIGSVDHRRVGVDPRPPLERSRRRPREIERPASGVEQLRAEHGVVDDGDRAPEAHVLDDPLQAGRDEAHAGRRRAQLLHESRKERPRPGQRIESRVSHQRALLPPTSPGVASQGTADTDHVQAPLRRHMVPPA